MMFVSCVHVHEADDDIQRRAVGGFPVRTVSALRPILLLVYSFCMSICTVCATGR